MRAARPTRPARLTTLTALSLLATLAPLTAAAPTASAAVPRPTLANTGFEQGTTGWNFTAGSGTATNNPRTGARLAYLDAGAGKKIWQTVTPGTAGTFDFTAWIATGGSGGTFTVRVNGAVAGTAALPGQSAYTRYTVPRVAVKAGDSVEIAFESGSAWVNVDDVAVHHSAPIAVTNPGFEQGTTGWNFTAGSGVAGNNPHFGSKLAYLDAGTGKKIWQTVTPIAAGSFDFSAWIATGGSGAAFTVRVNGAVAGTVALPSRSTYARYTVSRVPVKAGDSVEIAFESGSAWVNVDDLMLSPAAPADPVVTSSDPKVAALFDWAKRKANSWVQVPGTTGPLNVDEGQPGGSGSATYESSYWAGYAHRSAYYSRDMAHQVAGASVLGLNDENLTMLRAFAASATPEHKYYPVWALNFDNQTYLSIDYYNPNNFVREVPAAFELVEKADKAYRWSGDSAYVNDSALWDFYRHGTKEFIELHDGAKPNGVAEGTGNGIFSGSASYEELGNDHFAEAGDSIGSQYQAFLAMAALAGSKGDSALAAQYTQKAADLKSYFNSTWSGSGSGSAMIRGYSTSGTSTTGWGKENSWFMPMKKITTPGARNDAYLDYIDQQASGAGKPDNIEAVTYLPDTYFTYNRNDTAWKWMQYVYDRRDDKHPVLQQGNNGDYPEVSFTLVSQTVEGLMGVEPDAPARSLATASHLPTGMGWLKIDNLRLGANSLSLRHDGATRSTLTNTSGPDTYTWEARFPGTVSSITVNGVARPVSTKTVDGTTYSYTTVAVAPGTTALAQAS
ncbi:carbohydrate-binding protein [Kitasatospora sp. NPDC096147]|uniref:carbohydrate-binding protein n=1 Tax=Kitasatospora sp. NPDC096147 TaxID=3364093 RepID=UPI0037FCA17A